MQARELRVEPAEEGVVEAARRFGRGERGPPVGLERGQCGLALSLRRSPCLVSAYVRAATPRGPATLRDVVVRDTEGNTVGIVAFQKE